MMRMLVAVDGSENSLRALDRAIELAQQLKDAPRICLINAHDDLPLRNASQFVGTRTVEDYLRELSETELQPAIERMRSVQLPFDVKVARGQPATAIADEAAAGGYQLVFLGSKGRTTLGDLLIGSVAQRVVEQCTVPVVLVR
jgi:nucleotide-binding universal stress UspA family protein